MPKRLILCCDGTWMDSDDGFHKPTLIPYVPTGRLQVPSNVTRIVRALSRTGQDGTHQIIYYHSGVGTSSAVLDVFTGGALGKGISENIREVYSFIAANYESGDEIILVGFSRGAFTARSVAGMIDNIGLLTRVGMDSFYAVFKDQENFKTPRHKDIFPTVPFPNKPRGPHAGREYKKRLEKLDLTRVYDPDGTKIRIQAVAVWDTVGALGIPNISLFDKIGLKSSTKEFKFYNTDLSGVIRHAFQALALDEHRHPFDPAVWERKDMKHETTMDLRQVWFPGAHGNVGGGYDDQEIANISLAWMMDQLASVGVAFRDEFIDHIFKKSVEFYEDPTAIPPTPFSLFSRRPEKQWAIKSIYDKHKPVRPWGLGKVYNSETGIYALAGKTLRTPGLNMRRDSDTGESTGVLMTDTNERIHSSVRIRLELEGLGLDDIGLYGCNALLKNGLWRLRQKRMKNCDPIPWNATWGPGTSPLANPQDDLRWVWEYCGPEDGAPNDRIMVEESLGPYERKLLLLNKGRAFYKRHNRTKRRKRSSTTHYSSRTAYQETESESVLVDSPGDSYPERVKINHPRDRYSSSRYEIETETLIDRGGYGVSRSREKFSSPRPGSVRYVEREKERYSDYEPDRRASMRY
ncbi:uncharacterized protein BP5553_00560 [Venustampulla echinocandica]|uniref:T6SS Phospholipase effector Tle1-like catalytic domain-containing protein n=1 Tax=Venustampulla echinocandica TaxID=2656787 RepID=A0A370TYI2_9HELO|nr:uncharacterized protein BP5553_00560 [Venustampulla echinocandica]RDL40581.1 hypothetical protein BP5553_00560 [Venustampulla echinocandica]